MGGEKSVYYTLNDKKCKILCEKFTLDQRNLNKSIIKFGTHTAVENVFFFWYFSSDTKLERYLVLVHPFFPIIMQTDEVIIFLAYTSTEK